MVLVTGCSTGIGRAAALAFVARGWTTVATARDVATLAELTARGAESDTLDVRSDEDRRRVVRAVLDRHGRLDALVNNAGYPEYGPFEEVGLDRWRAQFETNVFGLVALSQLAIPPMRAQRWGRIINVSSMGGVVTFPLGAPYHASKFAVEGLSDVARMELAGFGIRVVVIEPGVVLSNFDTTANETLTATDPAYGAMAESFRRVLARSYRRKTVTNVTADQVAQRIVRAATARRPRTRYVVPSAARALLAFRRVAPDRLYDAVVRTQIH